MTILATEKSQQNRATLDPWTVVHFATGLAAGLMDVPLRWAMAASVGYEAAEQVFERRDMGKEFFKSHGPESLPNAVADSVAFYIGHRLGGIWNRTGRRARRR